MSTEQKFYRPQQLGARWGVSGSTIRRMMREGRLPPPISISERIFGWPLEVILKIEADRKAAGRRGAA